MKSLISTVKSMSVKSRKANHRIQFLDTELLTDPMSQRIMKAMNSIDIRRLGIHGKNSSVENYYFQKDLNRVTIEGNDDYRLVLFFIKKGMEMPLHDHPNMSVYFKLLFGKLNYTSYDKIDAKFKYNQFSSDEYEELLQTKRQIKAKKSS